jgi:hypothetical protein
MIQAPKLEPPIMRHELSNHEWTAIKPALPNKPRSVRRVNDRRVLNGIFWVLRSGAPWRDLPENQGPRLPTGFRTRQISAEACDWQARPRRAGRASGMPSYFRPRKLRSLMRARCWMPRRREALRPFATRRGFFPWRLSDDGPQCKPNRRHGPSSETLHRKRH